jgi:hypothetical protein
MKRLFTLLLFVTVLSAHSQSKQLKVLLQQIAALKVYGNYVQKGYGIAQKGLTMISDIKNGELNLHTVFYNALATVNPKVRSYAKVGDIITLSLKISSEEILIGQGIAGNGFTQDEANYIGRVISRLQQDCESQIDLLTSILTDDELEMDDAMRIAAIDRIHAEMTNNYTFIKSFASEAVLLAGVRQRELKDIEDTRSMNGINTAP